MIVIITLLCCSCSSANQTAAGTLYQELWANAINNDPDIITLCN